MPCLFFSIKVVPWHDQTVYSRTRAAWIPLMSQWQRISHCDQIVNLKKRLFWEAEVYFKFFHETTRNIYFLHYRHLIKNIPMEMYAAFYIQEINFFASDISFSWATAVTSWTFFTINSNSISKHGTPLVFRGKSFTNSSNQTANLQEYIDVINYSLNQHSCFLSCLLSYYLLFAPEAGRMLVSIYLQMTAKFWNHVLRNISLQTPILVETKLRRAAVNTRKW